MLRILVLDLCERSFQVYESFRILFPNCLVSFDLLFICLSQIIQKIDIGLERRIYGPFGASKFLFPFSRGRLFQV